MRSRTGAALAGALITCAVAGTAEAQTTRALALGGAALGVYAAYGPGSERCPKNGSALATAGDAGAVVHGSTAGAVAGRCYTGWFNHERNGDPLFEAGEYKNSHAGAQQAGGLVAAGVSALFAVRPQQRLVESFTYLGLGTLMTAAAFDYSCGGISYNVAGSSGCVKVRGNHISDGYDAALARPALAYGGLGLIGMGVARYFVGEAVSVNLSRSGVRISTSVGW